MASNTPILRQISWFSVIPQIMFMFFLIYIYHIISLKDSVLFGTITYLIFSVSLRYLVPKSHREGMKLIKENNFEKAILKFENSYSFFSRNKWIDEYRYLTLLSSSKMTYKEMALCNIAFSYSQIGNRLKTIEYYKKTLDEFPENGLAQASLKMLDLVNQ